MEKKKLAEKVYCHRCKIKTNHDIISSHSEESHYPNDDFQWWYAYHIVECRGCDKVAFVKVYGDESMVDFDELVGTEYILDYTVYPEEPIIEKNARFELHINKEFRESPEAIQAMYSQITSAFNMESYLLAAVGLRMLIEGLCKDLGINGGFVLDEDGNKKINNKSLKEVTSKSLEGKINGLIEKGIVVQTQANILHQIRLLGNSSAHELQVPSRKTVKLAIEVLEKILEQIYELHKYQIK